MAPMQSFVPQVRLAVPVSGLTFAARVIPSAITLVPRQPHLILPPLLFSLRLLPGCMFFWGFISCCSLWCFQLVFISILIALNIAISQPSTPTFKALLPHSQSEPPAPKLSHVLSATSSSSIPILISLIARHQNSRDASLCHHPRLVVRAGRTRPRASNFEVLVDQRVARRLPSSDLILCLRCQRLQGLLFI